MNKKLDIISKIFFFDKPIIYFRRYDFNAYVNYLKKRLSDKTVKDIVSLLKQIFKYIEVKYDINFKLSLIKSPTVYQRKIDVFTEREKNRIKTYCLFKLFTGKRHRSINCFIFRNKNRRTIWIKMGRYRF